MTDLHRRGWNPAFEFKDLEHSWYPFAAARVHLRRGACRTGLLFPAPLSINRIEMRRQDQVALGNHALVGFASALDPIMRNFSISRPQNDNFILARSCGPKCRLDKIDGLPDFESVAAVCHRRVSFTIPGLSFSCAKAENLGL